jgi:hypothetical protein
MHGDKEEDASQEPEFFKNKRMCIAHRVDKRRKHEKHDKYKDIKTKLRKYDAAVIPCTEHGKDRKQNDAGDNHPYKKGNRSHDLAPEVPDIDVYNKQEEEGQQYKRKVFEGLSLHSGKRYQNRDIMSKERVRNKYAEHKNVYK